MSDELGAVQQRTFEAATKATTVSYPPERRLSAAQLAAYLDRRSYAVIGTRRRDGRPHAAMSGYLRQGCTFWLPTVAGSVRERNIGAEPWLTMTVTEGDGSAHVVVLLEGPAVTVAPDGVPAEVRAARTADWVSAWIRFTAERVLSYAAEGALP